MRIPTNRAGALILAGALTFLCTASVPTKAADHFLTIGGGDSPTYNQVSLEKNVLFFQHLLEDVEAPDIAHEIFFSDGDAGSRDVQYVAADKLPQANLVLARLFNQEEGVNLQYRPHKIPNLAGASSRTELQNWFSRIGQRLGENDRLFIYFTGHGGPGGPNNVRNTNFSLWNDRSMSVVEFTGLLDKLSPKVSVVLIMVQCHSGGFADVMFNNGRVGPIMSAGRRCGFFATTPDRNAAGCTADISEEDYRDYSTYFFAALDGKTRTGKPVTPPDYDHDGRVSFAEAHAYTVLNSDTIDIPITSSDVFLRQFSKARGDGLLSSDSPFDSLLEHASPAQRIVLEGLAKELKLKAGAEVASAKQLADKIDADRKNSEKQRTARWNDADRAAKGITQRLTRRWPELSSPWNPRVPELLRDEGARILNWIEGDRQYARFRTAYEQFQTATDHDLTLDHQWSKCQRFLYTADSVALAANLEQIATPSLIARYRQIIADEAGTFPVLPGKR